MAKRFREERSAREATANFALVESVIENYKDDQRDTLCDLRPDNKNICAGHRRPHKRQRADRKLTPQRCRKGPRISESNLHAPNGRKQ